MAQVIVFDFDKTLTRYDTILPFFVYCASKNRFRYVFLPVFLILKIFSRFGIITVQKEKEFGIRLFCPLEYDMFQEYARQFAVKLKSEAVNSIYTSEFMRYKQKGARVVIASASFTEYLRYIFPEDLVIGSQCKVTDSGRITGLSSHPYQQAKADALKMAGIDAVDVFYTDSSADMSVANMSRTVKWVKDGAVVA